MKSVEDMQQIVTTTFCLGLVTLPSLMILNDFSAFEENEIVGFKFSLKERLRKILRFIQSFRETYFFSLIPSCHTPFMNDFFSLQCVFKELNLFVVCF